MNEKGQLSDFFRRWEMVQSKILNQTATDFGLIAPGNHITVIACLTSEELFYPSLGGEIGKIYRLVSKADLKKKDYDLVRTWFKDRASMGGSGRLLKAHRIIDIIAHNNNEPVFLYPSLRKPTQEIVAAMNRILKMKSGSIAGKDSILYIATHARRHQIWVLTPR